jgi:hypothetical protein
MISAIRVSGCPDSEADAGLLHRLKHCKDPLDQDASIQAGGGDPRREMIVQVQAAAASARAA